MAPFKKLKKQVKKWYRMDRTDPPPGEDPSHDPDNVEDHPDPMIWSFNSGKHVHGQFCYAAVRAHEKCETFSQVEVDTGFSFFGIYDGREGHQVSRVIMNHIFNIFLRNRTGRDFTLQGLYNTILEAEEEVKKYVDRTMEMQPLVKAVGSSCLVGVIYGDQLLIANVGDSRVVLGVEEPQDDMRPEALTTDDNINVDEVRAEFRLSHPTDPKIVTFEKGIFRIKGIIQVTKSLGDMYMKRPEYALNPKIRSQRKLCIPEPCHLPLLSSTPTVKAHVLRPEHRFLVFASHGLWANLSEEQVCEIVRTHNSTDKGVAEVLVSRAVDAAGRKKSFAYDLIKYLSHNDRNKFHDDITVIVVYLDHNLRESDPDLPRLSVLAFDEHPIEEPRISIPKVARRSDPSLSRQSIEIMSQLAAALNTPCTSNTADASNVASLRRVASASDVERLCNVASTSKTESGSNGKDT